MGRLMTTMTHLVQEPPGASVGVLEEDPAFSEVASVLLRQRLDAHRLQSDREQGDREQNGDEHGEGGGDAHLGDEADVGHHQRYERHDDGGAGEYDGGARGAGGPGDGVIDRPAAAQLVLVSGEHEQAVVDPDRKPQHGGEDERVAADGGERSVRKSADHTHPNAEAGDDQVRAGGTQRPESHQEDEEGGQDADDLAGALLRAELDKVPAELDAEVFRCGLLQVQGRLVGRLLRLVVQPDIGECRDGDALIGSDVGVLRVQRVRDRSQAGQVRSLGEHVLDAIGDRRVGDRPGLGREDQLQRLGVLSRLFGRKLLAHHCKSLGGARVRDGVLGGLPRTVGDQHAGQTEEQGDPDGHHHHPVGGGR